MRDSPISTVASTRTQFDSFFDHLIGTERKPIVVVTIREGEADPVLPLEELESQVADAADIFVLPSQATYWLTDELQDRSVSVHSGWVRVYPASPQWMVQPTLSPRFAPFGRDRKRTVRQIVEAVLAAAYKGGPVSSETPTTQGEPADVVVVGPLSATQALVETTHRMQSIMNTSRLVPGISADRLVQKGQRFSGRIVREQGTLIGEFRPDPITDNATTRAAEFVGEGLITSALVTDVSNDFMGLQLHPQVPLSIRGVDEDLTIMAREGDVITIEVVPDAGEYLVDFSSDLPSPAMSILPGGPPWLLRTEDIGEETSAEEDAGSSAGLAAALTGLSPDAVAALDELERVRQQLETAEQKIYRLQSELRDSRRLSLPAVYADPEAQLQFELYFTYLTQVAESDRARYPWPEKYRVSHTFTQSAAQLVRNAGITRERVIAVCVDVLCGRAREMATRAVKPWARSDGRVEVRAIDGAKAMRVRLQVGSRAARRLKYWQIGNGEIELDSVGVHDDGI